MTCFFSMSRSSIRRNRIAKYLWAGLLVCALTTSSQAADLATHFQRLPATANAMVTLDVDGLFNSPIGKREEWEETYRENYFASPLIIPPASKQFVLGADFELASMKPRWQVGCVEMKIDRSIDEVHLITGGEVDKFGEFAAIWPSPQACVLKFAPYEFGLIFPADRKLVTTWAQLAERNNGGPNSAYLRSVAAYAAKGEAQIVLALDLTNVMRPQQVRLAVQNSVALSELDEDAMVRILSNIQGMTLGVRARDKLECSMKVSFNEETAPLKGVAKQVIINVLKKNGAMIPDIENWQERVEKDYVVLAGELSTTGMRQLFSLISLDTSIMSAGTQNALTARESDEEKRAIATLRYFRSVKRHVLDLQDPGANRSISDKTLWLETYARKIERLPVGNVDPEMVAYGQFVSESFRYMIDTIQYAHSSAGATPPVVPKLRVSAVPTANVNNYGGYRVREYVPLVTAEFDAEKAQQVAQQRAKEIAAAEADAKKMLDDINIATNTVADTMSSRYSRGF